jgi:hypothetical protein
MAKVSDRYIEYGDVRPAPCVERNPSPDLKATARLAKGRDRFDAPYSWTELRNE